MKIIEIIDHQKSQQSIHVVGTEFPAIIWQPDKQCCYLENHHRVDGDDAERFYDFLRDVLISRDYGEYRIYTFETRKMKKETT